MNTKRLSIIRSTRSFFLRGNLGYGMGKMIKLEKPTIIQSAGNKPKRIEEFIGRVNSETDELSVARMKSPSGWTEPGQRPQFNEYTVVLKGMLRVTTEERTADVHAGESVIVPSGEWVQYSTPGSEGAEYIAVCSPAFSPEIVHRDE
jgi:mannose-6-phosphate isomerase-like protein (cupin superfamily)